MSADLVLSLFRWLAGIATVFWSGALMAAWILGLLDKTAPGKSAATTNLKDR